MKRAWMVVVQVLIVGAATLSVAATAPATAVADAPVVTALAASSTHTYSGDGTKSGSGGTASRSGCRTVTLKNVDKDFFGKVVYDYKTWVRWCWRYGTQIYGVQVGSAPDTGVFTDWEGDQSVTKSYYAYRTGKPRSGYLVDRVGKFGNCPWFGCVEHWYPRNVLRAHSNGTYTWRMEK